MEVVQSMGAPLYAGFRELRLQDDESVIRAVRTWLREQEMSWYREGRLFGKIGDYLEK
jgi:hypothetical protein